MSAVARVIVPCGGKGTRMRAVTGGAPKELLPLGEQPVLAHVLRECASAGIREALVVIAPDKRAIADAVAQWEGKPGMPSAIAVVVQPEPRGLADAVRLGQEFARGHAVAVALPDNVFFDAPMAALAQVIDTHGRVGTNVVGLTVVRPGQSDRYGPTPAYSGHRDGDLFHIGTIPDKPRARATFQNLASAAAVTGIGRYVLGPNAFDAIELAARGLPADTELDDIPMLQILLGRRALMGRIVHGSLADVGIPAGYVAARMRFGKYPVD